MSLDSSLRLKTTLARHRNVLSRAERIAQMQKEERWKEGMSALGLPKLGHRKAKAGKKKAKEEAAAEAAAAGTAAAPAAGAKAPATPPGAKPAAKPGK
jgi:small basic protein (TIGR04137 family)